MRADSDPANLPLSPNYKNRWPCDVISVDPKAMIDAVGASGFASLVEQDGKRIVVTLDVFLRFKQTVDFLRGHKNDSHITLPEFSVRRLELSQLSSTVGSPSSAQESHNGNATAKIVKIDDFSL